MHIRLGLRNRIALASTSTAAALVSHCSPSPLPDRAPLRCRACIIKRTWFLICQAWPSFRIPIWSTHGASA